MILQVQNAGKEGGHVRNGEMRSEHLPLPVRPERRRRNIFPVVRRIHERDAARSPRIDGRRSPCCG